MKHINHLIRTILVSAITFSFFLSLACAPGSMTASATTPEPTSTATATPTPEPTPTPTPAATPTPTPMPELTYEQKKALLGINDDMTPQIVGTLYCYNITFNNESGRIWCVSYTNENDPNKYEMYSVCNREYLFTLQLPAGATGIFEYSKYLFESSKNLRNLVLVNSTAIADMASTYDIWNIDYNNNGFLKNLQEKTNQDWEAVLYTLLSKEQIVDLIIDSTPQDEIIPFWVYTPGAQIPEELKGIYSEEDYPPAPAE